MPESDREFKQTTIHLCQSIFHNYLKIHLKRMKLSFSFFKASYRLLLGMKYFEKKIFIIFDWKKGLILPLQHAAFGNGHT